MFETWFCGQDYFFHYQCDTGGAVHEFKTRIIVLHMKEVVYTIAFLILAVLLLNLQIYFLCSGLEKARPLLLLEGLFIRLAFTAVPFTLE